MPFPILLYTLFHLAFVEAGDTIFVHRGGRGGVRGMGGIVGVVEGVEGDGGEGRVGGAREGVAFFEAGFDFEDGVGEEDGFLLQAR